ncbi:neugrin [Sceloporus undulatus]|uniref:neugrin n=1 Tax=Sceloporus undulatus TaxID=8520 RepID=UPI001C4B5076|nr:neugrin [Sceloporus undulatus]
MWSPGAWRWPVLRKAGARLASGGSPREPDPERALRSRRRLQKAMEAECGAPLQRPRSLSRQAMEQMRFLGREGPSSSEEWPLWRLARGFGVSRQDALRVLRSRFVPSPERAAKQDASAARAQTPRRLGSSGGRGTALPAASDSGSSQK